MSISQLLGLLKPAEVVSRGWLWKSFPLFVTLAMSFVVGESRVYLTLSKNPSYFINSGSQRRYISRANACCVGRSEEISLK